MAYEMFTSCTWLTAGTSALIVSTFGWYVSARIIEYRRCRARLRKVLTVNTSTSTLKFIVAVVYSGLDISLTMAELMEVMSTTRSRRYVLYLAVKSIRQASVRELALGIMHINKPKKVTFFEWLKATFTVADV